MNRLLACAALSLAVIAIPGCNKHPEETAGKIKVVVSLFPIYDIVQNIGGEKATVFFAVPPGTDPHTFEPRPSTARKIQNSALFIGITPEFDGWIERFLHGNASRNYLMTRGHTELGNPHIWLSVRKAKTIAERTAAALEKIDPANRDHYRRNLAAYMKKLNDLDAWIASLFAGKKERSFIQWHEAWDYFAADYGLTVSGTVQHEGSEKASVRSIQKIVRRARQEGIAVIVMSENVDDRAARVLAKEIDGRIVRLDGIGDPGVPDKSDYIKLMRFNAAALASALR